MHAVLKKLAQPAPALFAGAGFVIAARLLEYFLHPNAAEDAYITFRAVYDWNARFGVTSFVWWLWLGVGAHALKIDLHYWSRATALCLDLWALHAIWIGLRAGWPTFQAGSWWRAVALWCMPLLSIAAGSGLEMHAAACLAIVAATRSQSWPGRSAAFLLAALRPDTALLAVLLARGWKQRLCALAGGLTLCFLDALVVGTFLPSTVLAKQMVYGIHPFAGLVWIGWMLPCFGVLLGAPELGAFAPAKALLLVGMIVAFRRARWPLANRAALAATALLLVHFTAGTSFFWWYALPSIALFTLLWSQIRFPRAIELMLAVAMIGVAGTQLQVRDSYYAKEAEFRQMGQFLQQVAKPGDICELEPIGAIGYEASNVSLLDEVGLSTPFVARRRATMEPGWRADLLRKFQPRFLALRTREVALWNEVLAGRCRPWRSKAEWQLEMSHYKAIAFARKDNVVLMERRTGADTLSAATFSPMQVWQP